MKLLAPFVILTAAIAFTVMLVILRPKPNEVAPERPTTKVEVMTVQAETVRLTVKSQGNLLPKIESQLAVEVSGRIIEMSPDFRAGGRFKEGDMLFRIDPSDYVATVAAREADLATARLSLAQEEALAEQAAADWAALGDGEASDLTLRRPQLAQAKALIKSASAALIQAERDLDRTTIRAPYDGLVLSKSVDLGQYVMANPANPVANIYATEVGEIRLPIALRKADFLNDPAVESSRVTLFLDAPPGTPSSNSATGTLSSSSAQKTRNWPARLTRFEATVDPSSRLIYAVAEVEKPFENGLRRGMFVEAEIEGKSLEAVYVLPRYALRGTDSIYLVTPENTLITRTVEILKTDAEEAILTAGIKPGDQVATSPIAYFVENMPVELISK